MADNILQIGLGGFAKKHLAAWQELDCIKNLYVSDINPAAYEEKCTKYDIPKERFSTKYEDFLDSVKAVDIVTPADTHFEIAKKCLEAEKDLIIEKPITMTSAEAQELHELAEKNNLIVQIGFHYRYNALTQYVKNLIDSGKLGKLISLRGQFLGSKRPRTDVGVAHTDALHFIDLINYLSNKFPEEVVASMQTPLNRGSYQKPYFYDDSATVLMDYGNGLKASVIAGYIHMGEFPDKDVPNATTTKTMEVSGENGIAWIDFEAGKVVVHDVKLENKEGTWGIIDNGKNTPEITARNPVMLEFEAFLKCGETREKPLANSLDSGVKLLKVMEAVYESAGSEKGVGTPKKLEY